MNVLGIETSCDETSASVVRNGCEVLSNIVLSQIPLHRPYGGVVPEIASRSHLESLPGILEQALSKAALGWDAVDAIAVTYGPGLASSLLVGLSSAKALALRLGKPLIGANHIEAHIYSIFVGRDAPVPSDLLPFTALVVSGGHTALVRVTALNRYKILGQTVDDAAGEAFDKAANLLGLGYPGGPVIDKTAKSGDPQAVRFPTGVQKGRSWSTGDLDPDLCFSFSGLKTALLYHLRDHPITSASDVPDLCASYQEAVADALVDRAVKALGENRQLAVVGGVSLNSRLREKLTAAAEKRSFHLHFAAREFCADNAAMVAGLAGAGFGVRGQQALSLDVNPSLEIGG